MRMLPLALALTITAAPAFGAPAPLQNATATFTQFVFVVGQSVDGNLGGPGVVNGWAIADDNGLGNPQTAVYETQSDVGGSGGSALTFTLTQNYGSSFTLGRFQLSVTQDNRDGFADGQMSNGDVTANWFVLAPVTASATNGATLTIKPDHSILASGSNPAVTVYTVGALTDVTNITGIRLQALADASLPDNGPGRHGSSNFVLQEFQVDAVGRPDPNADLNADGDVDGADLAQWQGDFGFNELSDADRDGDSDGADFLAWQQQLQVPPVHVAATAVPEPQGIGVIGAALAIAAFRARWSCSSL